MSSYECNDGREDCSVFVDTGSQVTMSPCQRVFGENGVKLIDPSTWMTLTAGWLCIAEHNHWFCYSSALLSGGGAGSQSVLGTWASGQKCDVEVFQEGADHGGCQ